MMCLCFRFEDDIMDQRNRTGKVLQSISRQAGTRRVYHLFILCVNEVNADVLATAPLAHFRR